ncbi:VOC family protein [Fulvivirga lutea]|uniref:VOC family protein n=1 Tax=Fulvivirga lutea TaxID=2810512 RepID=A0A975A299_9BACT|nr:VOC family protein [Fulvivirga lutea]QSE99231.1 VOC family protein [Fulvivirga lutea]
MKNIIITIVLLFGITLSIRAQEVNKYFVLHYTIGEKWDVNKPYAEQPYFSEHSQFLKDLRSRGIIKLGARYSDIGQIIFTAKDQSAADSLISLDASVKNGIFKADIYPFNVFYYGEINQLNKQNEKMMKSAIQNFQIPVTDFERAYLFYTKILNTDLQKLEYEGSQLAIFPFNPDSGVGGTLIKSEGLIPSKEGTMVYLHAGEDLSPHLERINKNGGEVINEKTSLGPGNGYFAIFDDTEGNRVGLYSTH